MSNATSKPMTIDMTPTWGEVGNIIAGVALSDSPQAIRRILPDLAKGMAAAQALNALAGTLSEEQKKIVAATLVEELGKQGF